MSKNKKVISAEDKEKIESSLDDSYGTKGEDWDLLYVSIKGKEKAFAVKAPTRKVWNNFRDLQSAGKTKETVLEGNLAVDCLVVDVEGCSNLADYQADLEIKPVLATKLSSMVAQLAMSGLVDSKKE